MKLNHWIVVVENPRNKRTLEFRTDARTKERAAEYVRKCDMGDMPSYMRIKEVRPTR